MNKKTKLTITILVNLNSNGNNSTPCSFHYKQTIIKLKLNELHIIMGNQFAGAFNYSDCIILIYNT